MSLSRARTQTALSGDKCTNHEAIIVGLQCICLCRSVKKQSAPILVNAGVEGNMKQQQQPSWYVIVLKKQLQMIELRKVNVKEFIYCHCCWYVYTVLSTCQ